MYLHNVDTILSDLTLRKERRDLVAFINNYNIPECLEYQEALDRIKEINRELELRRVSRLAREKAIREMNRKLVNSTENFGFKAVLIALGIILLSLAYYFTR
jgi:hypothetical protein